MCFGKGGNFGQNSVPETIQISASCDFLQITDFRSQITENMQISCDPVDVCLVQSFSLQFYTYLAVFRR